METVYIFVGEGLGVPGLPHRLTKTEAAALGVSELLDGAIENRNYKAEATPKRVASKGETTSAALPRDGNEGKGL